MAPRRAPLFVTLEGIDGSGKSTLARRLAARLRREGLRVKVTQEETTTWLGAAVRRAIRTKAEPLATAFLFLADRAQHTRDLEAWLASGSYDVVLSDRYADSTIAYQAATLAGTIGEDPMEWLGALHDDWALRPDVTFLLDVDPKVALARIRHRKSRAAYEKLAFLRRVVANYRRLARREAERMVVLNGAQSAAELVEAARTALAARGLTARR